MSCFFSDHMQDLIFVTHMNCDLTKGDSPVIALIPCNKADSLDWTRLIVNAGDSFS